VSYHQDSGGCGGCGGRGLPASPGASTLVEAGQGGHPLHDAAIVARVAEVLHNDIVVDSPISDLIIDVFDSLAADVGGTTTRVNCTLLGCGLARTVARGGGLRLRISIAISIAIPITASRGCGRRGRTSGTGEAGNSRAREGVGTTTEGVDENTLVVVLVGTWDPDKLVLRGPAIAIAGDANLSTARVELGTLIVARDVESKNRVLDEVFSRGNVVRKSDTSATSVKEVILEPSTIALLANLINLEPTGIGMVELVARTVAGSHIGHHGADVVGPATATGRAPVELHASARSDLGSLGSRASAGTTGESRVVSSAVGVLAVDGTDDRGVPLANAVASELPAVDVDILEDTVGGHIAGGEEEGEDECGELHCSGC